MSETKQENKLRWAKDLIRYVHEYPEDTIICMVSAYLEREIIEPKEQEISELKDYCNSVGQLVRVFMPICPTKNRKLLEKAMADGKKLRSEATQRIAKLEGSVDGYAMLLKSANNDVKRLSQYADELEEKMAKLESSLRDALRKLADEAGETERVIREEE